ncbi:bromodomain-containing protein 140 isoform X2 [Lycorma delicatula]|uniref:bromodomain-containing protein 140 isoform X2 n=1 Tax=Lycorma delicatula TaxID=130591 RepID=UPI003F516DE7
MGVDFDVLEFCRKLRTSNKPPYTCPVVECGKSYKSMCGLQYHLVNFDHNAPQTLRTPAAPVAVSPKKSHRKKGRHSHFSRSQPAQQPDVFSSPAREGLTYAEAQKFVEFELNGKVKRISIHQIIPILAHKKEESDGSKPVSNSIMAGASSLARSQEAVSKLPEPCFKVLDEYNIPDAPPRPNAYIRFIERSAEEMDGEVEYDMDEEDAAWLGIMNERRVAAGLTEVSIDTFELLMDRLEKESYFQMSTSGKGGEALNQVMDDEAVCCICMDGECENSNVILFCDMCNLAVHQDCYGVPYIPEGQWLCRRCLQSPSRAVDCVLCPNIGGAFKQTDRGHWAHVVCALWIPEVRFANTVFLEPIDSIETIPPARWKLTCYICKQRGVGACIQCHKTNCYSAFHVTCAQQAGLYMKMDTVVRDSHTFGGEPGPVMVQKTAYCDTHTPADSEMKSRAPQSQNKNTASEDKANMRRLLAKKRSSVPVISIPTIPPDRIQEIGSLVTIAKKSQFIQRLIAYWTLKRHFRNGVPLLRRLQSSHLSRRDEPRHNQEVGEMYRQLKYWQCLRQDLERVRLLCELVRKREKMKKELIKVKAMCMELELCPLNAFLRQLVDLLRNLDTGEIFIEPVDQTEVPDYGEVVKHPMDLSTMRSKIDDFCYSNLDQFEADFNLMIQNCLDYNAKDTVFYRAAIKMRDQGGALLRQARRDMDQMGLDPVTGLLLNTHEPPSLPAPNSVRGEQLAAEIDKELADITDPSNSMDEDQVLCKLLQLLDRSHLLKHALARNKRVKRIKAEIAKLKRKKSKQQHHRASEDSDGDKSSDDDDDLPLCPPKLTSESTVNVPVKKNLSNDCEILSVKRRRRKKTWEDYVESPVGTNKNSSLNVSQHKESSTSKVIDAVGKSPATPNKMNDVSAESSTTVSPSGVNRRTAVLFTRKAAAQLRKPDTSSPVLGSKTNTPARRRGRQPKRNLEQALTGSCDKKEQCLAVPSTVPSSDSFRIYRSGADVSDEESHSDEESSCSGCSSSEGTSGSGSGSSVSEWSDTEDESSHNGNQEALEQLQLVWAKCRGYPWYPALIINPKMPQGYVHNGVPIPSPPADVLALANNYTEPVYLVLFFDTKRTWQWLPRNKLELLGVTDELDQIKLTESRKPADRKAVRKAYQEAMVHRTQTQSDKKEEKISNNVPMDVE